MAIGAAVGGVASAVGGAISAGKMAKAQKKIAQWQIESQERIHEASAADREKYSQMSLGHQDIAQQNLLASESARVNIMQSLGQPGTYGDPYTGGAITLPGISPLGTSGMSVAGNGEGDLLSSGKQYRSGRVTRKDVKIGGKGKWKGKRKWEVEGALLDADQMADAARNTSGFRQVSQMVAEAEQIMNRKGEAWNQLNNSIVGSIYESGAAMHKQQLEMISKNMAQGGSTRRVGLQMAQAMQVQENTNRVRTGELWQAKAQLEEFRTQNAQQVSNFSQQWVNNQAGIRDAFTASLNQLQLHWSETMAPTLAAATVGAQSATQQGVLKASGGLNAALQTKMGAIQSGIGMIGNLADGVIGSFSEGGMFGSPTTEQALANAPWNE